MKPRISHSNAPIVDTLLRLQKANNISFHTPGHNNGLCEEEQLRELMSNYFSADLSCSLPELDVLSRPSSIIKDALELVADLFKSERSFFLVNGSSSGNQAMILSSLKSGDKIIVPVNAHKSVHAGLVLSGAIPCLVVPKQNSSFNIPFNVTVEDIDIVYKKNPDAKAILILNPNSWGIAADIEKISKYARKNNLLLLIDEAHGSHFVFSDLLPKSACDVTADIWVQSAHKTLSSFTQTSFLHANSQNLNIEKIEATLDLLQTTSPNYPLLASLDSTRRLYYFKGRDIVKKSILLAESTRKKINRMQHFKCLTRSEVEADGFKLDLTKLTISSDLFKTGFDFAASLRKEKIYPEMADTNNVLLLINGGTNQIQLNKLITALTKFEKNAGLTYRKILPETKNLLELKSIDPRKIFFMEKKLIGVRQSVGKICAEPVMMYPPGVPIIASGHKINATDVAFLLNLPKGVSVNNYFDPDKIKISVVREKIDPALKLKVSPYSRSIKYKEHYFVYNSLVGFPLIIDEQIYKILNDFRDQKLVGKSQYSNRQDFYKIIEDLIDRFVLVSNETDERKLLQSGFSSYIESRASGQGITGFYILLTDSCNFNCPYCLPRVANSVNLKEQLANEKNVFKSLNQYIKYLRKNKIKIGKVNFRGGEPLLYFKLIQKVISHLETISDIDFRYTIITNGSLVNETIAKYLASKPILITLSMDGQEDAHNKTRVFFASGKGTFKAVVRGLKLLHKYKADCRSVYTTLTDYNVSCLSEKFADFLSEHEVVSWVIEPDLTRSLNCSTTKLVNTIFNIRKYAKSKGVKVSGYWEYPIINMQQSLLFYPEFAFCKASQGHMLTIKPDSTFTVCNYLTELISDINSFEQVEESKKFKDLITSRAIFNIKGCRGCELEGQCKGGCSVTHFEAKAKKSDKIIDYRCDFYKKFTAKLAKEKIEESISHGI